MKHVIIGTAGHIDHGKTTLIKALTGRNTDRLKEEQERGITIDLGFTYFDLPSGQRAGIIDVPGHEKFIKNMLAGVFGIDIVLLVIAADEGVMPQTLEHLYILDLLGTKKGFIVLTKCDLVDEDWMELVEEDIKEEVKGTFLENSPIVRVSSVTKEGINRVIELIEKYAEEIEEKDINDTPRLPVDRVFTVPGFGTVVTGTLLSGKLSIGDEVQIFPGNKRARIRTIQVHEQDTETAYGGQRVAINLAGLKKEDVERGNVVAPVGSMKDTMMLDVKLKLLKNIDRIIQDRTRLRLYLGTKEILCRAVLLDKEQLGPGEEAYAQLRLEEEVVAKRGDRFVVRFYSPMLTLGGGIILDPNPKKKKKFDETAINELKIKEIGTSKDVIEKIIEDNSENFPSTKEISVITAMLEENIREELDELAKDGKVITFQLTNDLHVIHKNYFNKILERILNELKTYHNRYPLRSGMPKEEIRSKYLKKAKPKLADSFIELLIDMGYVEQRLENICIKGFEVKFSPEQLRIKNEILERFRRNSYQPPRKEELEDISDNKNEIAEVFTTLVNNGEIVKLNEDIYIEKNAYDKALEILKNHLSNNPNITIGEYRDLLNTNRKVAIALLEYFDKIKITKRVGDYRIINKWLLV